MKKEKYERAEMETIEFLTDEVLVISYEEDEIPIDTNN